MESSSHNFNMSILLLVPNNTMATSIRVLLFIFFWNRGRGLCSQVSLSFRPRISSFIYVRTQELHIINISLFSYLPGQ